MNQLLRIITAIGFLLGAQGAGPGRPEVPDSLKPPAGEELILMAHAKGEQIYFCQPGPDQKLVWVLKRPEAQLTDAAGKTVIHHFAGPTWKHVDGSEVKGKVVAKLEAPKSDASKPEAIPWLLLTAASHDGEGILSRVTSIQRLHTEGGVPPGVNYCDAAANGKEVGVVYAADYYFYAPAAK